MKVYLTILILLLFSCKAVKKEQEIYADVKTVEWPKPVITGNVNPYKALSTFKGDTLAYVQQNFLNRKEAYVNKPLSVLLTDLEIPLNSFRPSTSGKNYNLSPGLIIRFFNDTEIEQKIKERKNPTILTIKWSVPLSYDEINPLIRKSHGMWTSDAKQYFESKVVENIDIARSKL